MAKRKQPSAATDLLDPQPLPDPLWAPVDNATDRLADAGLWPLAHADEWPGIPELTEARGASR